MGKDEKIGFKKSELLDDILQEIEELNCGAERHHYSMFNVGPSMFDVQSVRRSSFKTTPYGINATSSQNNIALMGIRGWENLSCHYSLL